MIAYDLGENDTVSRCLQVDGGQCVAALLRRRHPLRRQAVARLDERHADLSGSFAEIVCRNRRDRM